MTVKFHGTLPGEVYSVDKQCQMNLGESSSLRPFTDRRTERHNFCSLNYSKKNRKSALTIKHGICSSLQFQTNSLNKFYSRGHFCKPTANTLFYIFRICPAHADRIHRYKFSSNTEDVSPLSFDFLFSHQFSREPERQAESLHFCLLRGLGNCR